MTAVISVFHHSNGISAAVVAGETSVQYWTREDGFEGDGHVNLDTLYEEGKEGEWIEEFSLPPLFSAAPDLLEACRHLLAAFRDKFNGWSDVELHMNPYEVMHIASEAISLATGEHNDRPIRGVRKEDSRPEVSDSRPDASSIHFAFRPEGVCGRPRIDCWHKDEQL